MAHWLDLKAADGQTVTTWLAEPAGAPRGAVVVVQEIFGVNAHIRAVAEGYAAEGYLALAQFGVVEFHTWGTHRQSLDRPDQIVFDLDPGEGISWREVVEAAVHIKGGLESLGLVPFVKTSGGKGYHVLVPLKPSADWDQVKDFAHDFARALEQAAPDRYTATLSKKARTGRIFVDYLRNGRGSTTVAPYSSRAKKGATISMPVTWPEIEKGLAPNAFPLGDASTLEQLKKADPGEDFFELGKALKRG